MIRYHLDENVHHGVAQGLRLRAIDVTTTTDADLVEAADEEQFAFAVSQGRVFFTHDQDFLKPPFRDAADHAGIVYCRQDAYTVGGTDSVSRGWPAWCPKQKSRAGFSICDHGSPDSLH